MSAFLVSKAHIDALVSVALFGVAEATALSGLWPETYFENTRLGVPRANLLGDRLLRENEASMKARYPRDNAEPLPFYVYSWEEVYKPITAAAALKLLDCYTYQACEHDGWGTSAVKRWCDSLQSQLVTCIPGYNAAPWAID